MTRATDSSGARKATPGFFRVVGALSLSGLLSGLALGTLFTLLKLVQDGQGLDGLGTGLVLYNAVALLFAVPIALLLGGPVYWLMSLRGVVRQLPLVLAAGILATFPFLLFASAAWAPGEFLGGLLPLAVILFAAGCLGGWLFWRIAGLRRSAPVDPAA